MDFGIQRGKQKHKIAFQLAIHIKFLKQAESDDVYKNVCILGKIISKGTEKYLSQNQGNDDLWQEGKGHNYGEHANDPWGASHEIGMCVICISFHFLGKYTYPEKEAGLDMV